MVQVLRIFIWGFSFMIGSLPAMAQQVEVYRNFEDFEAKYLKSSAENDTLYVFNFWATWCAPCVKELPTFEKVIRENKNPKIQFVFASLDFDHQIDTKLRPFVMRRPYMKRNVAIADSRQQKWIDQVSEEWSGSIPMTLIRYKNHQSTVEGVFHSKEELLAEIKKFTDQHIK